MQEDRFEWGNPECLRAAGLSPDSTEYKLSSAAYRWRRKIKEDGKAIFIPLLFLFCCFLTW